MSVPYDVFVRDWRMLVRYFGSKTSTLPALSGLIPLSRGASACDPFGGIGVVGSWLRGRGYTVTSGDILSFATAFQTARLSFSRRPTFQGLRSTGLNGHDSVIGRLRGRTASGWVHREFAVRRQFFTIENARRIDGARRQIWRWRRDGYTSDAEHAYLIAALIDSMDRVANTAGTYYAHLKGWNRKSRRQFAFEPLVPTPGPRGSSELRDALGLVRGRHFNLLYLDPPYNSRRYERYYHLPETIATGRRPAATGASGVPNKFVSMRALDFTTAAATRSLEALVAAASFDALLLHYSDDGLIPPTAVRRVLSQVGHVDSVRIRALGYSPRSDRYVIHRIWTVRR